MCWFSKGSKPSAVGFCGVELAQDRKTLEWTIDTENFVRRIPSP
jgi:hypothetical protein